MKGDLTIEREYAPDREAMKAALRVVLGIPEPTPEPDGSVRVTVDFRMGERVGAATFTLPLDSSGDVKAAIHDIEQAFTRALADAALQASGL